jgi:hypothetical protein
LQGENNLGYHTGNVLDNKGYACMLPTLISTWRKAWSIEPKTTSPDAAFGIVMLADSTDEGWGANVPQMHWAQTANHGIVPNKHLPNTFMAAAHDLADPWDDDCKTGAQCCKDTGKPVDPACGPHRGYLIPGGAGHTEPTTQTAGLTIHPRVKRQVGARLAQAAWSLVYEHPEVAYSGPVISGCALTSENSEGRTLKVKFNSSLLKQWGADEVAVSDYNKTEKASVMWVLINDTVPTDADRNYLYQVRQSWWGDSNRWINCDISADPSDSNAVLVQIPPGVNGEVTAIKYGHSSPNGSPQNGVWRASLYSIW